MGAAAEGFVTPGKNTGRYVSPVVAGDTNPIAARLSAVVKIPERLAVDAPGPPPDI
jgi:hypothetical protein